MRARRTTLLERQYRRWLRYFKRMAPKGSTDWWAIYTDRQVREWAKDQAERQRKWNWLNGRPL